MLDVLRGDVIEPYGEIVGNPVDHPKLSAKTVARGQPVSQVQCCVIDVKGRAEGQIVEGLKCYGWCHFKMESSVNSPATNGPSGAKDTASMSTAEPTPHRSHDQTRLTHQRTGCFHWAR